MISVPKDKRVKGQAWQVFSLAQLMLQEESKYRAGKETAGEQNTKAPRTVCVQTTVGLRESSFLGTGNKTVKDNTICFSQLFLLNVALYFT